MADAKVEILAGGLAKIEELEKLQGEMDGRTWRASEIRKLRALYHDDADKLRVVIDAETKAKAEDRFEDDEAKTYENLRRQFGAGQWILRRGEIGLITEYAKWADEKRLAAFQKNPTPDPPGPRPTPLPNYNTSALNWIGAVTRAGGMAVADLSLGIIYASEAPEWLNCRDVRLNPFVPGTTTYVAEPEAGESMVALEQGKRWRVLQDCWGDCIEAFRSGATEAPYPMLEGFSFEPILSVPKFDLAGYRSRTLEAKRFLAGQAKERIARRDALAAEQRKAELAEDLRRAGPTALAG